MAVIIRETRIIGGKQMAGIKVYKSDPGRLVTKDLKDEAEKLDVFLHKKMEEIRKELKKLKILSEDKKNVLKIRYELGKRLCFVDDSSIIHPDDRKYIWRALFDHAPEFAPGEPDERADNRPETSFFSYCYKLGKLSREMVEFGGDWSSWQRFFDLSFSQDKRILSWFGEFKMEFKSTFKKNWLKETTKLLTEQFGNRETTLLTNKELDKELKGILDKLKQ